MSQLSHNQKIGSVGEDIAAEYIVSELRMQIVEKNWRRKNKEIDIIAILGDTLRIIEVKSRSEDSSETIASSLNEKKLSNLAKGASLYVASQNLMGINEIFFDLVEVIFLDNGEHTINYIPKFFYPRW